jgi:hypothetical protein
MKDSTFLERADHRYILTLTSRTEMPIVDGRRTPRLDDYNNDAYVTDDRAAQEETGIGAGMHIDHRFG